MKIKSLSHVQLFANPWTVAHQPSLYMGFSRQEYWSGLPFPSPGHLPDRGIQPRSPTFQRDALTASTCNSGDPGLIPGLGRSLGEGIGYPLSYFWASRVAQLVTNLPAMRETWVRSVGWEDPLEKKMASHSSILAWKIP